MNKLTFFLELYKEFVHFVKWPKWNKLKIYVLIISISTVLLSIILHCIDELFIILLKKIFAI